MNTYIYVYTVYNANTITLIVSNGKSLGVK